MALAQADLPDAGLPDAAVDESGDGQQSEESQSQTPTTCLSESDCVRGFQCIERRCTWRPYRDASFSACSGTAASPLAVLALLGLWRARRGVHFLAKFTK